jgi:hypothetical protein
MGVRFWALSSIYIYMCVCVSIISVLTLSLTRRVMLQHIPFYYMT